MLWRRGGSACKYLKGLIPLNSKTSTDGTNSLDLTVVVPLYNEEESLPSLYSEIASVCEKHNYRAEFIFVDDGSTDNSFKVLESLHQKDERVKILQFRLNAGKSEALSAGFSVARGRMVVTMDADLQDDPAEIPNLIRKLEEGYDIVSGWKKKRQDPLSKKLPSRLFNFVTSRITGIPIHDFNCGLKIYRQTVLKNVEIYGEHHRYIPVLGKWAGFKIGEIPVHHRARKYGKTKYGLSRFLNGFLDLIGVLFLSKYMKRPLHLFGFLGILSSVAGFGITFYLLVLRIFRVFYLSNRPLLFIGIMLIILGIQFISIGLLGEMIIRMHGESESNHIKKSVGI
jgi:glycosyltransferase involved in cell wall biosynthesis